MLKQTKNNNNNNIIKENALKKTRILSGASEQLIKQNINTPDCWQIVM